MFGCCCEMGSSHSSETAGGVKKGELDTGYCHSCQDGLGAQGKGTAQDCRKRRWLLGVYCFAWGSAVGCGPGSLVTEVRAGDGLEGAARVR